MRANEPGITASLPAPEIPRGEGLEVSSLVVNDILEMQSGTLRTIMAVVSNDGSKLVCEVLAESNHPDQRAEYVILKGNGFRENS